MEQHETEFANRTFKDIMTPNSGFLSPIVSPKKLDEETVRQELSPYTRGINNKVLFDYSRVNLQLMEEVDRNVLPVPKSIVFADKAL